LVFIQFNLLFHFLGFNRLAQFIVFVLDLLDTIRLPSLAGLAAAQLKLIAGLAGLGGDLELVVCEERQAAISVDPFLEIRRKAGDIPFVIKWVTQVTKSGVWQGTSFCTQDIDGVVFIIEPTHQTAPFDTRKVD